MIRAEPRITLFLEHRVNAVEQSGKQIHSVTAQNTRNARLVKISDKFFADCTGDATVGFLAGADYLMSEESNMGSRNLWNVLDQSNPERVLQCECKDKDALSLATAAGNVAACHGRST